MPKEVTHVVERCDRVIIEVERTYPDQALPWVISDILLRTNGSRLYVPSVVESEQTSPPRFKLQKLPYVGKLLNLEQDNSTPVIIVNDPNLQSPTRSRALIEEANAHPSVRFVVIVKRDGSPTRIADFAETFNAERFVLADFSLEELSSFLSSNFDFEPSQSAVLATKLNDTFEQFNMHAHPSYFAGISPETLRSFIAANRRGELIQLAIDGALMILVTADTSDVHVSRGWRREFLKDIVVRHFVKGEDISEMRAVEIAKEMAEARDVEIKPLEFVQSFVEAGILDFRKKAPQFFLVYLRDYLIAEHLHERPHAARSYFDFDQVSDDFNVLDIYSELGPSEELVEYLAQLIEKDEAYLNERRSETIDSLMSTQIRLSSVSDYSKIAERSSRLIKAIAYVGENPTDLERKQYLLDIQRSVSQRAGEGDRGKVKREKQRDNNKKRKMDGKDEGSIADQPNENDDIPREKISSHCWAGLVVLSSGAEKIYAVPKRRLARGVMALACRIAEQWTAETASIDIDELREEILDDPSFKKRLANMADADKSTFLKDFDQVLHNFEFSYVTTPYRSILTALCGHAHGNILRKSVKEVRLERDFEKITQAVWICDLEAEKAESLIKKWMNHIEKSAILRLVLAQHFVSRVYWAKWKPADRMAFLEVATKILDGPSKWDKGRMKRMIQKSEAK